MKVKHSSKGKAKDNGSSIPSGAKVKEPRTRSPESSEETEYAFPMFKSVDKGRTLHCYSAILSRGKDEGVTMEDLDRLQPELEMMLSTVAVRLRTLQAEVEALDSSEEARPEKRSCVNVGNKKRKVSDPRVSKSMKDLAKFRERENAKMDLGSSENDTDTTSDLPFEAPGLTLESSKVIIPKNDTPNKFWASVEPFCGEIAEETVKELEDMIANCDNDLVPIKVPPLGKHYTARWADDDMNEEKEASNLVDRSKRRSTDSAPEGRNLLKRASALCRDKTPGPLVQRLVSALMEETVTAPLQESFMANKMEETENGNHPGKYPHYHSTSCFERRLRRELEVVGLLDSSPDDSDEILNEIKKCDQELKAVASLNKEYLQNTLSKVRQELPRQELRNNIRSIDNEVIEMYRKIMASKIKKKPLQKKEREQAWKVLKDREALLKNLHQSL